MVVNVIDVKLELDVLAFVDTEKETFEIRIPEYIFNRKFDIVDS